MKRLALIAVLAASPALAATYSVGPGQPLATIGAVPWATLAPGDEVLIHWRPTPYREKWVICRQGTAALPIIVRGVPGPLGELPIIDGAGAVTAPGLNYWSEVRGVIKVGGANTPADLMPRWIVIEGLDIRGARDTNTFVADDGSTQTYGANASAIYVEKAENFTVRGCTMHDCGNGFFVASSNAEASREILVEGNRLYDNGNVGSIFEHGSYTAAAGITFQHNWYGPLLPGAGGNNLKDRSSGLVVRENWIEGGNRQLDLVDAEDSGFIRTDPRYFETHVHGNILVERVGDGNRQIVHYGGDSGSTADYRKGVLHFYNNTIVSHRTDRTTLFRLSTDEERCDARNNIIHAAAAAGGSVSLLDQDGVLDWSHNLLKPGWVDTFSGATTIINDDLTSIEVADPGFVDEAGQDFHLAAGSPAVDAATVVAPAVLPAHDVVRQYVKHQADEPRPRDAMLDVGAFERDSCALTRPPALVTGLRFVDRQSFTWAATPDAASYDVLRGALPIAGRGLAASLDGCLESASPDTASTDASAGAWYYVVRAVSCGGTGSFDSGGPSQLGSRDPALGTACP